MREDEGWGREEGGCVRAASIKMTFSIPGLHTIDLENPMDFRKLIRKVGTSFSGKIKSIK